jgi:hypothetical protein
MADHIWRYDRHQDCYIDDMTGARLTPLEYQSRMQVGVEQQPAVMPPPLKEQYPGQACAPDVIPAMPMVSVGDVLADITDIGSELYMDSLDVRRFSAHLAERVRARGH